MLSFAHVASARDRSRSPPRPGFGQASGTVKAFHETWGFLVSPQVTGDIFCHLRDSPQFTGPPLQPGETVVFELVQRSQFGRNNGLQAVKVQRKMSGSLQQKAPMAATGIWQPVTGTLKKIRKGMAFCFVEGIIDDVLLGERSLMESGIDLATLKEGDSLTFEMAEGPKGYHATNIQRAFNSENWPVGQRTGTLKKICDGMGFCHVEGVDGDVLLGRRSLDCSGIDVTTLAVGDTLTFEMSLGSKGYHATNIRRAVIAWHGQAGQRVAGKLKKIGNGMGFCSVEGIAGDVLLGERSLIESGVDLSTLQLGDTLFFDMGTGPKGYHATNIQQIACRVTGTLKKIGNGMGFCSVGGIAGDVLLGERSLIESGVDLSTLQLGDTLTFQMAAGPKGYYATNIQQAVDPQPGQLGQRATGRLKKIHKAMGFCSVAGIDGDVLLGERSLKEAGVDLTTMQPGEELVFDLHWDIRGYHATNIQRAHDWSESS